MNDAHHTYLGNALTGYGPEAIWLTREQRFEHVALLGATGVGKSSTLRAIAAADIARGDGLLYLDPHGDEVAALLDLVPPWRHNHVCLLDLADLDWVVALNVLEASHPDDHARVADALVSALRDIWHESWGPRMESILRHATLALLAVPQATIALIPRLLTDDGFRRDVVAQVENPLTRRFFLHRYEEWRTAFRGEAIEPVLNKLDSILSFPAMLHTIGSHKRTLKLEDAMHGRRIVLANLAKGLLGESGASVMGALLIARARTAAMTRARLPAEERVDFHVLVDEVQNFATNSVPSALAELRKFSVSLTYSTQILLALSERTRAALLGTTGTLVAFRTGPDDAQAIAPKFDELHRSFNAAALNELARGEAIIKVGAEDVRRVQTPSPLEGFGTAEVVRHQARRHYAQPRVRVEQWVHKKLSQKSGS